jgi:hypothetical protein
MAFDTDWIYLDQDWRSVVGAYEHGNERLSSIKFSEFLDSSAIICFSEKTQFLSHFAPL